MNISNIQYNKIINMNSIQKNSNKFINAHINNISFPKTIEELEHFIYERGSFNVEDVINECSIGYTIWTVPRNSAIGDIVLYFHAKTAIQWIRKLETATRNLDERKHDKKLLTEWLTKARGLYSLYGGKIFAIGRIKSRPESEEEEQNIHWSSRIYAKVGDLVLLQNPIDINEFNSFITVSRQSAITPLPSNEYQNLKNILVAKNDNLPEYYLNSKIGDYNLSKINATNFLQITKEYRTRFLLEANFRSYYVDYLLHNICGKNFYKECQCHTSKKPLARVDNIFRYNGKLYMLEVKLNINLEKNLIEQLRQYINAEYVYLTNEKKCKIYDFEKEYIFVIDTLAIYKYSAKSNQLSKLLSLDEFKALSDIQKFTVLI